MRKPLAYLLFASLRQFYNPCTYTYLASLLAINTLGLEILGVALLVREVVPNLRS